MKRVAIINTQAWQRHTNRHLRSWMDVLRGEFGAEPFFTGYTGHAGKLAEAVQHADCIIAAGGDGTLHEVINAMDLDRQSLAVVPIGTGNGFGRALGLDSVSRAFQAIREGRTRRVNLVRYRLVCPAGEFTCRSISTAGSGFLYDVVSFANHRLKGWGSLSYPLATLAMLRQKPVEAAITIDGAPCPIGAFTVVLVNSTSYAGNFCVFPDASLDDAFFHILVANPGPFRQLRYNMSLLAKTYGVDLGLQTRGTACRIVPAKGTIGFMVDGETFPFVKEVECALERGRLKIIG